MGLWDGKASGVLKSFNIRKGYGFILTGEGKEVFFHIGDIQSVERNCGKGTPFLVEGMKARFTGLEREVNGVKRLFATNVNLTK